MEWTGADSLLNLISRCLIMEMQLLSCNFDKVQWWTWVHKSLHCQPSNFKVAHKLLKQLKPALMPFYAVGWRVIPGVEGITNESPARSSIHYLHVSCPRGRCILSCLVKPVVAICIPIMMLPSRVQDKYTSCIDLLTILALQY